MISSVEMDCTLGCAFTLEDGGVPDIAVGTLGARFLCVERVKCGRSVVAIDAFVSPSQCSMVSWRALMSWSYASTVDYGVFLSAAVSFYTPCSTLSSGVTGVRVSL